MEFISREEEMSVLEEQYSAQEHSFVIVKGRRRVGKSRLIREFIKGKYALYFQVDKEESNAILVSFGRALSKEFGIDVRNLESWTSAMELYLRLSEKRRRIIVLDEFQYIIKADKNAANEFQSIWDNLLSKEDVMFIISGSYKTLMDKLTEYDQPLYGRNTCDLTIRPLEFRDCIRGADYRYAVEEYAFTGGIPHYMQLMNRDKPVLDNIESLTMKVGGPLLNEVPYLMGEEFRDLKSYNTYLKTIAAGDRRMESICSALRVRSNEVFPYLTKLIGSGILERRVPITDDPEKSRNGLYVISDRFISTWFRFVYPYRNDIVLGINDEAISDLEDHFINNHAAFVFEDICRSELKRYLRSVGISASYGSYWNGNVEIDVAARDKKNRTLYLGECKLWRSPVGRSELERLVVKSSTIRLDGYRTVYCLFSVSGYNTNLTDQDLEHNVILFDNGEVVRNTAPGFTAPREPQNKAQRTSREAAD